uniref:EamA domain-containing protein n=1 Tax=Panagrellus redivivus TaxID=6233 RepID=A0A7E4W289_PANRE
MDLAGETVPMSDVAPKNGRSDTVSSTVKPADEPGRLRKILISLALSQVMSLCLAGTGTGAQILSNNNFRATVSQNVPTYIILAVVYGFSLLRTKGVSNLLTVLKLRGWKYFLLALVDVEANILINNAYYYTNLTSIQLLNSSIIPMVMALSFVFLKTRYGISHFIGVIICFFGVACVIYADSQKSHFDDGPNPILGDILCMITTMLYAISNTAQEAMVKEFDRTEYLGCMSVFGLIISALQIPFIDRDGLAAATFSWPIIYGNVIFTTCLVAFYVHMAVIIANTSALMLNLTGLTSDFYTFIAGVVIFGISYQHLYLISFVFIIIGTVVFAIRATSTATTTDDDASVTLKCNDDKVNGGQEDVPEAIPFIMSTEANSNV